MQQIRGGGASEVLSVSIPSTSTTGGALKSPQLLAQNFHSLSFLSPPSHLTKVKNHKSLPLLSVLSYSLLCFSCCNNGKQLFVSLCVFVVF
jgi:hypothetical protein